ncbi:hypothetical protein Rsub_00868 [Raphidocelis subcapitata]|uniref:Anaphase-promoting complex subunit 13 n=1 Tax=Raphidocelis subcapitata TaxID=307507 RepID=A0A2V0NL84_9CHLO|nr:hypothetical protein Rsub_00868 [Raphidocelis subcapitata]|eukprot:GBF88156.1 hypothetical protein Rsub_00868 [Raphidocelis subcapitata]
MAHTIQSSQLMDPFLIDVVDEEWMRDALPDDEVPLPAGVAPPADDSDDLLLRKHEPRGRDADRERWRDLGLESVH